MNLMPRDVLLMMMVAHLGVSTAAMLRRLYFPNDPDGRGCRRRLQALVSAGLLARTRVEVVSPLNGMCCPVYYSTRKGLEFLAVHCEDPRYLGLSFARPSWQTLQHACAVAETHLAVDEAAA